MWNLVVFFTLTTSWASGQNGRGPQQDPNGRGWDIRLAVPGEPGSDYPTLATIPRTSFSCSGREPGYYADVETNCQAFRVCTLGSTYGFQSFLCPNGTLFNQAVFVCDWWMNVNCDRSQQFFNSNDDKFGNLKLGPQLMKDIKKMLTHPMRNPYDKSTMKSNLIVMQDYRPPSGQLFPNNALIPGSERAPSNVFLPPRQNYVQTGYNDLGFSASTASPQYVPPSYNTLVTTQREAEIFQRQRQNNQFGNNIKIQTTPHSNTGNLIQNGHGQIQQAKNTAFSNNFRNSQQRPYQQPSNGNQQIKSKQVTQTFNSQNSINGQRGQYRQNSQNNNNRYRFNSGKQTEFGVSFSKQYTSNSNQDKEPNTYKTTVPQFTTDVAGQAGNEAKQNLVSNDEVPSTVITKTLTFNRIVQEGKVGPKSKITFKTWIVKPKAAKLEASPTPYTYDKPTQSPTEKLVSEVSPYVYNKPPVTTQASKLVSPSDEAYFYAKPTAPAKQIITEPEPSPYEYIKPTVAAKQVEISAEDEAPYIYNKPTPAAKQVITNVQEPSRRYLTPTSPQPTLSQLYLTPSSPLPTKARVYLAPTTYKPSANYYLPPSEVPITLSRQYLPPNSIQPEQYQSAKLQASPTTPTAVFTSSTKENINKPSFTLTKHSRINANHNNLTFADILTKEKLDITVNDIVKDTSSILKTAAPQFGPLQQSSDYLDDENVTPESAESDEKVTSPTQTPSISQPTTAYAPKSGRLTAANISTELEPPFETPNNNVNVNPLANLPYFKEPPETTNTIERTVSLKISIPEKIAKNLFKNNTESGFDKLEILNTGSSNYLVLSNNFVSSTSTPSFIPLGKLTLLNNSNVSNSQALVFSFLADSLNVAKEYSNIAQQNLINQPTPATAQPQFQNVNSDELARITNQISQLTSSQYSGLNYNNLNNFVPVAPVAPATTPNQFAGSTFRTNFSNQRNQAQNAQYNTLPSQQSNQQFQSAQYQNVNNPINTKFFTANNQNQLYSGQLYQLPVPDVTSQIYNGQISTSANLIQNNNKHQQTPQQQIPQHHLEAADLQQIHNINPINTNSLSQNINNDIEIVRSQSVPLPSPAKLQATTATEPDYFNSQENSAQTFLGNILSASNGISAQLQDKIVGTIPHPLEQNKYLTYKKDQSYYVYTKLDNNNSPQYTQASQTQTSTGFKPSQQAAKLIQSNKADNKVSFQFVPSVSYQLDNEKDQQNILNAFNIDEYGSPKESIKNSGYQIRNQNERKDEISSDVNYTVDHPLSTKQLNGAYNGLNALYAGPSSYSAPQASVGKLESRKEAVRNGNNFNSRIEQFDDQNNHRGY